MAKACHAAANLAGVKVEAFCLQCGLIRHKATHVTARVFELHEFGAVLGMIQSLWKQSCA